MRWLMIGFLVSLAALLVAVAGAARHIWLHRANLQGNPDGGTASAPHGTDKIELDPIERTDREL